MNVIEVLALLRIEGKETIKGRIVAPELASVDAADERSLVPIVLRINQALQDAGLLGKWRAKVGGTTDKRWILIVGER